MLSSSNQTDGDTLELIVDRAGVLGVMAMLVNICDAKADHLRANWQDEAMARDWERVRKELERSHARIAKLS